MEGKFQVSLTILVLLFVVGQIKASTCYSSTQRLNTWYGYSYSLSSPNYPFSYYSNQNCNWYIVAPYSSMVIKVTFTYFYLETSTSCTRDYVELRDGSSSYSTFISRFCSNKIPPVIISRGRYLYIKFRSDYSMNYRGFQLTYAAVNPVTRVFGKCSSLYSYGVNNDIRMTSEQGDITSPNYPLNYPNSMQCTWKITVPSGKKIRLNIDDMSMQPSVSCSYDYLQVRDGYSSSSFKKGDYCGTTKKTIYSTGRYLWIRFRSDYRYTYKGFKLSYSTQGSSGSSAGLIVGVLVAIAIIVGIIVGIVFCMKKKRRNAVVVHNTVPNSAVTTTTVTNASPYSQGVAVSAQGPPTFGQPEAYPQKGQPYPNPYPGPPPPGQPNPYPGPPPTGQPNPYPGPPPPGQPNPYPGPPPPGQPNPYPGPPPPGYPNPAGPPAVSM